MFTRNFLSLRRNVAKVVDELGGIPRIVLRYFEHYEVKAGRGWLAGSLGLSSLQERRAASCARAFGDHGRALMGRPHVPLVVPAAHHPADAAGGWV